MLKVSMSLDDEFEHLYNEIHHSEKGHKLLKLTGISREQLDVAEMSHKYFMDSFGENSIDHNANITTKSPLNYGTEIVKPGLKLLGLYLLHRYLRKDHTVERADELIKNIIYGDYYFHDASGVNIQMPYCFAYSTLWIINNGMPWGQLHSNPPKSSRSFLGQVVEVTMDMAQNFAGAIAPADVLIHYAHFAKKEQLGDKEIENQLQGLVHILNKEYRPGGQSPFCNISLFDKYNMKALYGDTIYPDGSTIDFNYAMHIQEVFMKWFCQGEPGKDLPYKFPIVTANFTTDAENNIKDQDFLDTVSKHNTALGCINIHAGAENKLASCCRLINDPVRMRQITADTFGNGGVNIGSHRVVTINLPRIAHESKGNWSMFYYILDRKLEDIKDLLVVHRQYLLARRVEQGFLKLFTVGMVSMNHFFSTIGFTGVHEAISIMGLNVENTGFENTKALIAYIDNKALEFSKKTGFPFNVEETPAESAAIKLYNKDVILYNDMPRQESGMYSNQFIPLHSDVSIIDRVTKTGELMKNVSGGAILHMNVADQIKHPEIMKKLISFAVKNGVTHHAINYGFSICENDHNTIGVFDTCPICQGRITDHMTRIVGYFVKTSTWNETRREKDFPERKWNKINDKE